MNTADKIALILITAENAERKLVEGGMPQDEAADIKNLIASKAGALLPAVSGKLSITLDDARMN